MDMPYNCSSHGRRIYLLEFYSKEQKVFQYLHICMYKIGSNKISKNQKVRFVVFTYIFS